MADINHFTGNSRAGDMTESQDDKFLKHNDHVDLLADRTQRKKNLYVGLSSGSTLTLGAQDYTENNVFHLRAEPGSPTLDNDFVFLVPAIQSRFSVINDTGFVCYVATSGSPGAQVEVPDGGRADLHCDGETILELKRDVYDIGFFIPSYTFGAIAGGFVAVRAFRLPAGLPGSRAYAWTPSGAGESDRVISIQKDEVEVGTVTFSAATNAGVFSLASDQTFNAGNRLRLVHGGEPSPSEANTLADISVLLKAIEL